jgi:signal transduction histidine kinase
MSFVLSREDFTRSRLFSALPLFLVLWGSCLVFILCGTFFVKIQLQEVEKKDVENRLQYFLSKTTVFSRNLDIFELGNDVTVLQGLTFVRLVKGREQLLLTENESRQVDFKGIANVDPTSSGVWVNINDRRGVGNWTIVSKRYENNVIIQAGKEQGEIRKIYERVVFWGFVAASISFPLTFFLALLSLKKGMVPINTATTEIAKILSEPGSSGLLQENGGSLGKLYEQINGILTQNRKLIKEMQYSLDNVAHDLRTPMTRLRSIAEYGLQADADPVRLADALSDCLEESERVLAMLNIMMSVAEAESGTMPLQKDSFDVADSINSIISLYEYIAEEKDITVVSNLENGVEYYGDKTRLCQVWGNLLDNSIKYGKQGGMVKISSRVKGDGVEVIFEDDGMGISENEIERIWERLYRGDRSRSQQGLGLGLNYVRAVVEAHSGIVSVSSALGEGARFQIDLVGVN